MLLRRVLTLGPGGHGGGVIPRGTRVEVFNEIYWVFTVLGILVGAIVFAYMLYNAYKFRHGRKPSDEEIDRPTLGEVPTGGGKGGKLFLSLGLSAVIVVSLIAWTYGTLLYVEQDSPVAGNDHLTVEVEGYQFGWTFRYPNGHESTTLRVPVDTAVKLRVTSRDVFHNFGIPGLKVKSDAIPGQWTETWFEAEETGEYGAQCYELCGVGHSYMTATVVVMPEAKYEAWYANTTNNGSSSLDRADGLPEVTA